MERRGNHDGSDFSQDGLSGEDVGLIVNLMSMMEKPTEIDADLTPGVVIDTP